MAVTDITHGQILGSGWAARQAKNVHRVAEAKPLSQLLVICPVGTDGTEVFFVIFPSLRGG